MLRVSQMINLDDYQRIFNIDNTSERCEAVLEGIDSVWKPIFDRLANELGGRDYSVRSYAVTLTTTYHDALNPKHAEQKKDSNIGRKYFIQITKKIGDSEVNALTLEFNGIDQQVQIFVLSSFYPIWEANKENKFAQILNSMSEDIHVFFKLGSHSKENIPKNDVLHVIKDMILSRKRPDIIFGKVYPLKDSHEESMLVQQIVELWPKLTPIRQYLEGKKAESVKANYILKQISDEIEPIPLKLFGQNYELSFGTKESHKTGVQKQLFFVRDNDQLLVKGQLLYFEFNEQLGPYQALGVDVDGHNHIYTNVRMLLDEVQKEWWIKKSFTLHDNDNNKLMNNAMKLLEFHDIHVRGTNEYYLGKYDNAGSTFQEGNVLVKTILIQAALLFAHVCGKITLPESNDKIIDIKRNDILVIKKYKPFLHFAEIYETIANSGFTFSKDIIRDLHLNLTALDDKHFVILSGISGTGKTQLARLYANAVYGLDYEEDNPYVSIIPVRPDWTDSTAVFGYYSSFEKRYVVPEFLKVILSAQREREKPHYIVLDEMNLARVEYYLSDYLSGVESHKEIPLHNREDVSEIPMKIAIPPNVYLIGTVNVDETTHSISDKVLDRAFVMLLSDVDFNYFWSKTDESMRLELSEEFTFLLKVHEALTPYHLHFGYRTMNEMLQKLTHHLNLEPEDRLQGTQALDRVVSEKVLPKIRGDESITSLLEKLNKLFLGNFGENSVCLHHIIRMEKELSRYGATQFWR